MFVWTPQECAIGLQPGTLVEVVLASQAGNELRSWTHLAEVLRVADPTAGDLFGCSAEVRALKFLVEEAALDHYPEGERTCLATLLKVLEGPNFLGGPMVNQKGMVPMAPGPAGPSIQAAGVRTEDLQRVAFPDHAAVAEQVRARPQVVVVVVLEATMPCFAEGVEQTAIEPLAAAGQGVLGVVQLAMVKMSFEEGDGNVRVRAVHVEHQVEDVLAQEVEEVVWLLDLHCRASEGVAELELDRTSQANQDPSRRDLRSGTAR